MSNTPETTALLDLEKARSAVAEWRGELARLEAVPTPVAERPSDVAKGARATAEHSAAIDAARHGLEAAIQRVADAHRATLTRAAGRYRQAAKEAAELAAAADADLAELREKVARHIPAGHIFRTAFNSQWPNHSAIGDGHRHTEWLNLRAARCCEMEAEGERLADHFGKFEPDFQNRFGADLWNGQMVALRLEDKNMCAGNLPPEVKALYTDTAEGHVES